MVWSRSKATPKSGVVGCQGRGPPFLCLLHLVQHLQSPGCPQIGLLSGAVAQGLHRGDSACIAESQVEIHTGLCPLGWKEGAPSTEEQRKAGRGKFSRCMSKSVTGTSCQINTCLFSKLTHPVFYFLSWVLDGYRDHWLPLQGCFTKSLISKHVQSYLYR